MSLRRKKQELESHRLNLRPLVSASRVIRRILADLFFRERKLSTVDIVSIGIVKIKLQNKTKSTVLPICSRESNKEIC
jgi:hypothetical protein